MRQAGRIAAEAMKVAEKLIEAGVTTEEIDRKVAKFIIAHDGTPAFKGYRGFPANICVSINEEVVHGIPSARRLAPGDIVSVDIGVRYRNYYGDCTRTFAVGKITKNAARILEAGRTALKIATEAMGPNVRLLTIAEKVQKFAESQGFEVVRKFVGHGIGIEMHEDPQVPNFVSSDVSEGDVMMRPGLVLALEPMLTEGTCDVETLSNRWTVVTKDRKLAVHFEDTVVVTETGREVLTVV